MGHIESNSDLGQLIETTGHVTSQPAASRDHADSQQDICRHELQRQSERTASFPYVHHKPRDGRRARRKCRGNSSQQEQQQQHQRSDGRQVLISKDPNVPDTAGSPGCQQCVPQHSSSHQHSSVSHSPGRAILPPPEHTHIVPAQADLPSHNVSALHTRQPAASCATDYVTRDSCHSAHDGEGDIEQEGGHSSEAKQSALVVLLSGDDHVVLSPRQSLLLASPGESVDPDRSEYWGRQVNDLSPGAAGHDEPLSPSHCALDRFAGYRRRLYRSGDVDRRSEVETFPSLVRTYSAPQLSGRSPFYSGRRSADMQELAASCGLISISPAEEADLSSTVDQITACLSRVSCDTEDRAAILSEKLQLQRALLYLECVHGRPACQRDRDLVRPLYERYRSLKRQAASLSSPRESASKELTTIMEHEALSLPRRSVSVSSTSPLPVERATRQQQQQQQQQQQIERNNYNNMSPEELRQQLSLLREEKLGLNAILSRFEASYSTRREARLDSDREMQAVYAQYRHVRAQLKLVHVLLAKSLHRSLL